MGAEKKCAHEISLVCVEDCQADDAACDEMAISRKNSRKIRWVLCASLLVCVANSWTFGAVFDVYLYMISGGSNSFVGTAESVRGLSSLGTAVPVGYLADKCPREKVLRVTSLCGLLVAVVTACGMLSGNTEVILLGLGLYAAYTHSVSATTNALLADLSPPGEARAHVMGQQTMVNQIGSAGGPLAQLALMWCLGGKDSWSTHVLMLTLLAGMLCMLLLVPVSFAVGGFRTGTSSPSTLSSAPAAGTQAFPSWAEKRVWGGRFRVRWVVVVLAELSFTLGLMITGISVKYFPLFFKRDHGFGPTALSLQQVFFPLFVAAMVPVLMRVARRLGTVPSIVLWTIMGGGLQIAFSCTSSTWLAVGLYFVRQAVMKSRDPLYQALTMDCLESHHRGRFGSLLSLRSATWAGSAVLGGLILDNDGSNYSLLFVVSGLLIIALPTTAILPLLCLVPRRTTARAAET